MAAPRTTFPPTVTAGKWDSAWGHLFARAQARYGRQQATDGTEAPPLSYADLAALTRAWRSAAGASAFPLWSQWAALAYDWDPAQPARFSTGSQRAKAKLDPDLAREFWVATQKLALDLDASSKPAALDVESGTFGDPVWLAMVKADLLSDGAKAEWKLPVGCRDPKTGKVKPPYLGCPKGWTLVEVSPGAFMCKNDATGELEGPKRVCEGDEVVVKDPIKAATDSFWRTVLILGLVWYAAKKQGNR